MIASMSAGDPPDLLMTWDANAVGSWGFEGVLKDLGPYIDQAGMDLAMYFPIGVASGNLMGTKQIGLPLTNYITTILYWNQKVFEDAGLDPGKAPETWEEMWETSEKLTIARTGRSRSWASRRCRIRADILQSTLMRLAARSGATTTAR
jgi:ABC-type glycerol-3-phosphate transport system substrate-binding protein